METPSSIRGFHAQGADFQSCQDDSHCRRCGSNLHAASNTFSVRCVRLPKTLVSGGRNRKVRCSPSRPYKAKAESQLAPQWGLVSSGGGDTCDAQQQGEGSCVPLCEQQLPRSFGRCTALSKTSPYPSGSRICCGSSTRGTMRQVQPRPNQSRVMARTEHAKAIARLSRRDPFHSVLMLAALMIGHHLSISAL